MTKILLNKCIENALALFEELKGEFYPFGMVMFNDEDVSPYYVQMEEEFPSSDVVLKKLTHDLFKDITNEKYKGAATCALATKSIDNLKYDFLDIKLITSEGIQKDYCVIIDPDYKKYTFTLIEVMEFKGTFSITATI